MVCYGFVPTYEKGVKGKYQLVVESNRWKTFRQKLKEITRKTNPVSFDQRIQELKQAYKGWINYFKYANIHGKLKTMDGWLRIKRSESRIPLKQLIKSKSDPLLLMAPLEETGT
jgi:hypothetical protein